MELLEVIATGVSRFEGVVDQVPADAWDNASPCAEWSAREVVGHMIVVMGMARSMARAEEVKRGDVPDLAQLAGEDPAAAWRAVRDEAVAAIKEADLDREVDTPMGPKPVGFRLAFPAMDLHLHAWDLGRATGVPIDLDPAVGEFARPLVEGMPEEMLRSPGVFAEAVDLGPDASPGEAFLAFTGRDPR